MRFKRFQDSANVCETCRLVKYSNHVFFLLIWKFTLLWSSKMLWNFTEIKKFILFLWNWVLFLGIQIVANTPVFIILENLMYLDEYLHNKTGQPSQCGATLITSVSFTYKLVFYVHNVGEKNATKICQKKIQSPKIFIQLGKAFCCFVFIEK